MSTLNDVSSLKFKVSDRISDDILIDDLISACRNNADYYSSDKSSDFAGVFIQISDLVKSSVVTVRKIVSFAGLFDFDEATPGNGYWSFVFLYEAALNHSLQVCEVIIQNRDSWLFRRDSHLK